ncbi:hypothetical protein [Streptomyces sp. NPDC058861]|uniref:hypothetical protein n=1 Tax=Streptomyces sp. NPDC058861 TaxID=3346653 RepID=UPI0036866DFA
MTVIISLLTLALAGIGIRRRQKGPASVPAAAESRSGFPVLVLLLISSTAAIEHAPWYRPPVSSEVSR